MAPAANKNQVIFSAARALNPADDVPYALGQHCPLRISRRLFSIETKGLNVVKVIMSESKFKVLISNFDHYEM